MSNRTAFLAAIGQSEVGAALIAETDRGYNVLVGSTPGHPLTFSDYSKHPDILDTALDSTAAGLYQINHPTYLMLSAQTGLADFGPATQDAMALQLIDNRGALALVDAGQIDRAMALLMPVWRSLPGATGGVAQNNNSRAQWLAWYQAAGGTLT